MRKETVKIVRGALSEVAPHMKLKLSFENPRYKREDGSAQRVVITYNADVAAERGVTEKMMRTAVKNVLPEDSELKTVAFEKTYSPKIIVDQDSVDTVKAVINENGDVYAVLQSLHDVVPDRKTQALIKAILTSSSV